MHDVVRVEEGDAVEDLVHGLARARLGVPWRGGGLSVILEGRGRKKVEAHVFFLTMRSKSSPPLQSSVTR